MLIRNYLNQYLDVDFRYQYHGWIGFTEVLGQLTPSYALGVRGSFLNNWQAPVGQNQGWALSLFSQIRLPKTKFEPRIGLFRDEADSSPAVYGSKNFGFKNRAGWFIGADVSWDSGFYARSEYTQASTLLSSPFQSEFEYFQLGIGTKYDLL